MNRRKIETLIGFAIKSRKIVFGEDQIKTLTKEALVIIDSSSSDKYKERVKRFAKSNDVIEIVDLPSLTHRPNVHSLAILDVNLAKGIKEDLQN